MARKPYVELPDILKLLPPLEPVDTEPEVGGPGGLLNQSKDQNISSYILRGGWYDDGSFIPSRLVLLEEPAGPIVNAVKSPKFCVFPVVAIVR